MAKSKRRVGSRSMTVRLADDVALVVDRLCERTGWTESRAVAFLLVAADEFLNTEGAHPEKFWDAAAAAGVAHKTESELGARLRAARAAASGRLRVVMGTGPDVSVPASMCPASEPLSPSESEVVASLGLGGGGA